jgi:hypothetical protein
MTCMFLGHPDSLVRGTGVIDTGGKFVTGGAPRLANIFSNFRKNLK